MSADNHYPTDLTDEQWDLLHGLLPEPTWHPGGRWTTAVVRRAVYRERHAVPQ
jgi:hypothetical protein